MSRKQIRLLAAMILTAMAAPIPHAHATEAPYTFIGVDISTSSPFLMVDEAADALAAYVHDLIAGADPGHAFRMTTFGLPGFETGFDVRATVGSTGGARARLLADGAHQQLANMPAMFRTNELPGQHYTSIIDFLEHFDERECARRPVHIILATDGIEYTNSFSGAEFIRGATHLPSPSGRILEGCRVTMVAVGSSMDHTAVLSGSRLAGDATDGIYRVIKPEWERFLDEAGATDITVLGRFF